FRDAGFDFRQISYRDGGDDERRKIIEEFRKPDSTIHGLVSCEVFTKGFDVPDVLCGISARPYRKSLSSHMQQMGRVMRSAPGKTFGLWLDHSGNVLRFMADTSEVFENGCGSLDNGKREESARKEPTERERNEIRCSCGYVLPVAAKACPGCGKERIRQTAIENLPGHMVELDGKAANRKYTWEQKEQFIAGLRSHAAQRGYQPGWVAHQYHSKFGVWPNDPRLRDVQAGPITLEVANWVRSQQIRFAKSRKAA
ncbi:MAG: DEAD/DEAH box helicase, partial [Luteibacter jiangsuensis]